MPYAKLRNKMESIKTQNSKAAAPLATGKSS